MTTSILERLRDALACTVEHPIPREVFSPFPKFNEATMEVVGDITDDEIRIIRLINEIGYERIRMRKELESLTSEIDRMKRQDLQYKLICAEHDFNSITQLLSGANLKRLSKSNDGVYTVASNGKVVRMRTATPVTH